MVAPGGFRVAELNKLQLIQDFYMAEKQWLFDGQSVSPVPIHHAS